MNAQFDVKPFYAALRLCIGNCSSVHFFYTIIVLLDRNNCASLLRELKKYVLNLLTKWFFLFYFFKLKK